MNRRHLFALGCIAMLSASCFAQTQTMRIAGVARTYIVRAPSGLSNPPLVLNIHGFNMSASSEQSYTQMDRIADRDKFVVVYPEALPNSSNQNSWDLSGPNDYAFILAIIDTMSARYQIDKNRIYACGFSQGGFMSFQLACRYSDIFAAIAPTSGTVSGACNLKRPVPMRLTFGTNEFDRGAAQTAQFMQSVTFWVNLIGCPQTPVVTRPYPASTPNSLVTRLYYGPCDQGTEVIADSIRTGGHEWPMNTNDRINNSEESWAFLKKFSLSQTAIIPRKTSSITRDYISASCASGTVRLRGIDDGCKVRIVDARGKVVATPILTAQQTFTFSNMPGGLYFIVLNTKNGPISLKMIFP